LFGIVLLFFIVALFFILTLHFMLVREIATAKTMIHSSQSKALAFSGLRLALEAINASDFNSNTTTVLLSQGAVSYVISTTSTTTLRVLIQASTEKVEESYQVEVDRPNNRISRVKFIIE